ncbi:MAG: molecular chaperone DnaJ [Gammaproteobacteria bacterium]|nr:MAG: molecular chaperone DnaJ [Gammaproteobacteria bacterium]
MLLRILLVVGAIGLIYWYMLQGMPPAKRRVTHRNAALVALGVVLVMLALTGRAHWLFGLIGGLLPFARRLLMVAIQNRAMQWLGSVMTPAAGAAGASGQQSEVGTAMLRMTLDHASGRLDGEILLGRFAGRKLHDLKFPQLLELLAECRADDPQGAALLESYLEREHAERWAEADAEPGVTPPSIDFGEEEARQILGVAPDADASAVRAAHRSLIQRLHPDRGGSAYLAAQINRAKELLLAGLSKG